MNSNLRIASMLLLAVFSTILFSSPAAYAQRGGGPQPQYSVDLERIELVGQQSVFEENLDFGEQINLDNGTLSFSLTDVEIPGNSPLRVHFGRRLASRTGYYSGDMALGMWKINVPVISGLTDGSGKGGLPFDDVTIYTRQWAGIYLEGAGGGAKKLNWTTSGTAAHDEGFDYVTQDYWVIEKTNSQATAFEAFNPRGDKYTFDIVLQAPNKKGSGRVAASRIEDVHGNWVDYDYTNGKLVSISSNDGRQIDINYDANSRITSVVANGRTWSYTYDTSISPATLKRVTLPDARYWEYTGFDTLRFPAAGCPNNPTNPTNLWNISAHHPSGMVGDYTLEKVVNGRVNQGPLTSTPTNCVDALTQTLPVTSVSKALTERVRIVPRAGTYTWTYDYEEDFGSFQSGNSLPLTKKRTITDPNGSVTEMHFYRANDYREGQTEKQIVRPTLGGAVIEQKDFVYTESSTRPWSVIPVGVGWFSESNTTTVPSQIVTTRGSDTYTTDIDYDLNPLSSSYDFGLEKLNTATSSVQSGSRITSTTQVHELPKWILNLTTQVQRNGKTFDQFGYNSIGQVITYDRFSVRVGTYTYHTTGDAEGKIKTYKDGLNHTTTISSYKRGQPLSITRADTVTVTQSIDDNGWVTSQTDGRNITQSFQYNVMGWLTKIDRPGSWADTNISYSSLSNGLILTATRGNSRLEETRDGLMRVISLKDESINTGVSVYHKTDFDGLNRPIFTSFPSASANPTAGANTTYDTLGRPTQTQETVAPNATTAYAYQTGNKIRVTDPSGAQTTTTYRAFGSPSTDEAMLVLHAMGTTTTMTRDIHGNILTLNQASGLNGYSVNVTRQFWYDGSLRLCRHRAPEFGDELFAYDLAGQMTSASRGETTGSSCAAPSASIRTSFTYDAMGRQTNINFPAGTADIVKTYDANGNNLSTNRGGVNWYYTYNELDLLKQEKHKLDGRTFVINRIYNSSGHLKRNLQTGNINYYFDPDGFGRPQSIRDANTSYVSGITYHPNGAVASATYGNGRTYSQSLTARLQPYDIKVQGAGGTLMHQRHAYDVRGKLTSLTDYQNATNTRSFGYDARGRLDSATGSWGTGSFDYDGLDNIREKVLGTRTVTVNYDANNRVASFRDTQEGNNALQAYFYDGRGNVIDNGSLAYGAVNLTYDWANQPTAMSGTGINNTYTYDGNLKRAKTVQDGKTTYWVYSALTGTPVHADEVTDNIKTDYLSGGGVSLRIKNGVAEYTHLDYQGTPAIATNTSGNYTWREEYTPFGEKVLNPSANRNDVGYTGHVQDDASGLTYMQARFYDPVTARFLSTDPIGYQDQLNLYAYVANDPVNAIDPTGEFAFLAIPAACGATGVCEVIAIGAVAIVCIWFCDDAGEALTGTSDGTLVGDTLVTDPAEELAKLFNEPLTSDSNDGTDIIIDDKILGQIKDRGWTEAEIGDLVNDTDATGTTTDNRGGRSDPASVYGTPYGGHVIVNDKTGEVVQVSDKDDWVPDDRITWDE